MSELEFTGERLVPDKSPSKLEAEHRARYEFACRRIEGRKVLDIGCGAGYGSYMMSAHAGDAGVVGVDIDESTIGYAKKNYEASGLNFMVADVTRVPFSDNEFTACVCFEVIEHIENPEELLKEAARVLDPSGIFIVSTPNGAVKVSSQPNPFHMKEFNLSEFTELIRAYFPEDKWYLDISGQFIRGNNYSKAGIFFRNLYLGLKGMVGVKPKEESLHKTESLTESGKSSEPDVEFEFMTEDAELAEYLVAVVRGK